MDLREFISRKLSQIHKSLNLKPKVSDTFRVSVMLYSEKKVDFFKNEEITF